MTKSRFWGSEEFGFQNRVVIGVGIGLGIGMESGEEQRKEKKTDDDLKGEIGSGSYLTFLSFLVFLNPLLAAVQGDGSHGREALQRLTEFLEHVETLNHTRTHTLTHCVRAIRLVPWHSCNN